MVVIRVGNQCYETWHIGGWDILMVVIRVGNQCYETWHIGGWDILMVVIRVTSAMRHGI
jgi:hypothetical protein